MIKYDKKFDIVLSLTTKKIKVIKNQYLFSKIYTLTKLKSFIKNVRTKPDFLQTSFNFFFLFNDVIFYFINGSLFFKLNR